MTTRRACGWLHDDLPLDGLGPILPGQEVTHGICETCAPLAELGHHVRRGLPWLRRTLLRIAQLEGDGQGRWGGTAVLAFWLCQRCKPVPPMSKAKHAQIARIAGSPESYQRLMRIVHLPGPKRLRGGWTAMDVTSYLALLLEERKVKVKDV